MSLVGLAGPVGNGESWVQKSNENASVLLAVWAKYAPEQASASGAAGLDEQISIPSAEKPAHIREDLIAARSELQKRLSGENNPAVRQDLEILIDAANQSLRETDANDRLLLPYENVAGTIFFGIQTLLNDQGSPDRRKAALARLRKYTGVEPGYKPFSTLSEDLFVAKAKQPTLIGPARIEVERDLGTTGAYVNGIGQLFEKYKIEGYETAYAQLRTQLAEHDPFVRRQVLPRARTDFRLPPELYSIALAGYGVDYAPEDLIRMAHQQYVEIRREIDQLAAKVAGEHGWKRRDFISVLAELKKQQLNGEEILPHYRSRLADIEAIIRREHLLTLPDRDAIIRLATSAETAQQPAPHMTPPPLMNNQGERGEFVLPLESMAQRGRTLKYDDFTFAAASWTLTAHEARPGHELQFSAMVERGVSIARAVIAYNSTNIEGWGLYAEWLMYPYMPDDGKLISLQFRLHRAARAFLDPELQNGTTTPEKARRLLREELGFSDAFATEEVERYTFRMPGQAVSYFDGLTRLLELRAAAQKSWGKEFSDQRFHDTVLAQGLLPPALLRKAVLGERDSAK